MRLNIREPDHIKAARLLQEATLAEATEVRADTLLQTLQSKTPAQVEGWIDANVNTMSDAKQVLKVLAKAVVMLSRN